MGADFLVGPTHGQMGENKGLEKAPNQPPPQRQPRHRLRQSPRAGTKDAAQPRVHHQPDGMTSSHLFNIPFISVSSACHPPPSHLLHSLFYPKAQVTPGAPTLL